MGLKPHKPSDYPSTLLYILDETHLSVTILTASYILYTRSAHSAFFAVGALASSLLAKWIKKFIKSPRPPPPVPPSSSLPSLPSLSSSTASTSSASTTSAGVIDRSSTKHPSTPSPIPTPNSTSKNKVAPTKHIRPKKTYGMPSTHSTALSFYFFYLLPLLLSPSSSSSPSPSSSSFISPSSSSTPSSSSSSATLSPSTRYTLALSIAAYWAGGIWSRVELGYHTWYQCFGGIALGALSAVCWRGIWEGVPGLESLLQGWMDLIWDGTVGRVI